MNSKTIGFILLVILGVIILAVIFAWYSRQSQPATDTPATTETIDTAVTPDTPATEAVVIEDATIEPDTPTATESVATEEITATSTPVLSVTEESAAAENPTTPNEIVEPISPTVTSEAISKLTTEEQIIQEILQSDAQFTTSVDECGKILGTEPWCSVIQSAVRVSRPEWEALFPQTEFFLVERILHGGEFAQQRDLLIIEQDGQRYSPETFDRLLAANDITTITDDNREQVARALVLITLSNYLEEEITFSDLEEGNWPAPLDFHYNYALTAWTKIQGLKIEYFFLFDQGRLRMARGHVNELETGDYIEVPLETMPAPSNESLTFSYWGR